MDPAEEKIIDLVDVVSEGNPSPLPVQETPTKAIPSPELTPEWKQKLPNWYGRKWTV